MRLKGWINSDMEPDIANGVIYLDVTEPLPFPDGSLQYVYSEHVLEHVTLETTFAHFVECYRALRPGGVIRIAMPDLQFLLDYFKGKELTPVQQSLLERTVEKFHPVVTVKSPALLLNDFVRRWGHQVIYDRQLLADLLKRAGFDPVVSCELQESRHADLANMEHHGSAIGDSYNRLQTMVLEATRPAR
jgi:predicted SAM-dependent methyltransferase